MYVIAVYDVAANRTHKPRTLLRQYLTHVQNSVFEGEVTEGELEILRRKLENLLQDGESVIVYAADAEQYLDRTAIGDDPRDNHQFI